MGRNKKKGTQQRNKIIKKNNNKTKKGKNIIKVVPKPLPPKENPNINLKALKNLLTSSLQKDDSSSSNSLRDKMKNRLKAARFRYLNQQMYTSQGKDAKKMFQQDPQSFTAYHDGYRQQVEKWPLNPLDVIIETIEKMPAKSLVIADFGCGEARLSQTLSSDDLTVHSFDLIASSPKVTACDMAHCPLKSASVDVAVYCLSLMGTNLFEFVLEANRVLKFEGVLLIAEVESRFNDVDNFIKELHKFGFNLVDKDLSCSLFYFLQFKKERNIKNKNNLPHIQLNPCLYKKR